MTVHGVVRVLVALSAIGVLVACGGNGSDDGASGTGDTTGNTTAVLPFADVQASDFVFEADPASVDRGIFHVTTTEPMICAIVWGETEALGNFNNSTAMNGTGIVEHDVFLPGAVAGTTYYFRVQGSTAEGSLYASELSTFTIPESTATSVEDVRRGPNLALDGTITDVSSEFDASFAAANAIDDSGTTEWSSAGDGDSAYITIDLGEPKAIAGVEFVTRSMADGSAIVETYSVTIDGGDPLGPFNASTPAAPQVAAVDAEGRLVRFDVASSTGGNVGAIEVRVLGP
jgi:F5/8 type C domain